MRLLKRTLPERIWRRLGRHPTLVLATCSVGYKVGRDGFRMRRGEIEASEFRARTGAHVGGASGGLAGAAVGAAWGSALPGLGTVLGAMAGGFIGEELGNRVGRLAVEQAEVSLAPPEPPLDTSPVPRKEGPPASQRHDG